jgi:hypothetical protein
MAIHIDLTVIYSTKFREKTRERVAKNKMFDLGAARMQNPAGVRACVAQHARVGAALGRVSAAFGSEIRVSRIERTMFLLSNEFFNC